MERCGSLGTGVVAAGMDESGQPLQSDASRSSAAALASSRRLRARRTRARLGRHEGAACATPWCARRISVAWAGRQVATEPRPKPSTCEIAEGGSGSARASCPPSAQGAANDAACISQHLRPGDVEVRERYGHALTIKPSWSGVELSVSVSLMTGQPASGRRRDCGRWWRRRCGGPLGDELLDGQAPLVGHLDEERARPHAR
jgi:hypothetical protein